MTPRDVLERLTLDERTQIASICMETMGLATLHDLILYHFTEDERAELGLRIREGFAAVE